MKSRIWTYGITVSLILSVLLSSCTSPYRILDSVHDCIHAVSSAFSGNLTHDHSHEILDYLEQQHNDAQHNKYVLDNQITKNVNEVFELELNYIESNFYLVNTIVDKMLNSDIQIRLLRPPII